MTLLQNATAIHTQDRGTKGLQNYRIYDKFFADRDFVPRSIMEIGVYEGESTKIFSTTFPGAKIIALDLNVKNIDFSNHKNVFYEQADQNNIRQLQDIRLKHFPDGVDFIIDDASHYGYFSLSTFIALFDSLRPNGIYCVEDWGTGYWENWPDGERFQGFPLNFELGILPKRMPSHDYGMVGFVKRLVDLVGPESLKNQKLQPVLGSIKELAFYPGICLAVKA